MVEWYIPWDQIDWGLKIQLLLWIAAIALSYWIFWRSFVRRRPWLKRHAHHSTQSSAATFRDGREQGNGTPK